MPENTFDSSEIDEILFPKQEQVSPKNPQLQKSDAVRSTQALFDEGKGKYVVVPAVATLGALIGKGQYNKKFVDSYQTLRKLQTEETKLLNLVRGSKNVATTDIASQVLPKNFQYGVAKPLSQMSAREVASLAKTDAVSRMYGMGSVAKEGIFGRGSLVKPTVTAKDILEEGYDRYGKEVKYTLDKSGKLTEVVESKPIAKVASRFIRNLPKYTMMGVGATNIPKLLNTANIYDYNMEQLRRGVNPEEFPFQYHVLSRIGGSMKALQNLGEIAGDIATLGTRSLATQGLEYLLEDNTSNQEEQMKSEMIDKYLKAGMNPIKAESIANAYIKNSRKYAPNPDVSEQQREQQKRFGRSASNFILETINAERPVEY